MQLILIGCAGSGAPAAMGTTTPSPPRPRLIALFVIDGLPQRQLDGYRDQFGPDGFSRFMERGVWFTNAHFEHAYTVTAAGHAVLLSGASSNRTCIIGNERLGPSTGAPVYCSSDRSVHYIGHETKPLDGTSPGNLPAETLGDALRRSFPRSKVIAISGKYRGAIFLAGKSGTAYMYMGSSGQSASSTYYMNSHPRWVNDFIAARPADRYFKSSWTALLPKSAYDRDLGADPRWPDASTDLPIIFGALKDQVPDPRCYDSLLLTEPSVAAAYTSAELRDGLRVGEPLFESMRKSWHAQVLGDVQLALKPNWMFGLRNGATHGSPYEYDIHVPLMCWGPR